MSVDVGFIATTYATAKHVIKKGKVALYAHFGIVRPLSDAMDWLLGKSGLSPDVIALLLAIHLEYFQRTGHWSAGGGMMPSLLSNKCSECGLKGHNKSNHPSNLILALKAAGAIEDLVPKVVKALSMFCD